MKQLLFNICILVLYAGAPFYAQQTNVLTRDSLLKKDGPMAPVGIILNNNWRFHAGDSMQWSARQFDDNNWKVIENKENGRSVEALKRPGIGWYRLKIRIDSSLYNATVGLAIWHLGASQIFLNGKFIDSFGKPGADKDKEIFAQPVGTPVVMTFSADSVQVLAIRFSNEQLDRVPKVLWSLRPTTGFITRLQDANKGITDRIYGIYDNFATQGVLLGILFALGFSHLLLYFFYSRNRLSLFFGLFALSLTILLYLGYLLVLQQSIIWFFIFAVVELVSLPAMFFFFVLFLFTIRFAKLPKRGYLYLFFSAVIAIVEIFFFSVHLINALLAVFVALAAVEAIICFINMVRQKIEGAGILISGAAGFIFLFIFSFALSYLNVAKFVPGWLIEILVYTGFSSLPFSMSLYLARNYSKTNFTLEDKLREVQELSAAAIEQERNTGELRLQNEMQAARAIESELRAKAAELQAKAAEVQWQALQAENDRTVKELEEARKLQLSMLPSVVPQIPGYEIAVFMKTATEVGGDYYDFIETPNELVFAFGDASGHGVKAGIMVTAAKSFFSGLGATMQPVEFMEFTSKAMKEMKLSPLYMCMVLGRLQDDTLRYVSAGMPQVLHYKAANKFTDIIESKNVPLGTVFQVQYKETTLHLAKGDVLLWLSDGFIEMFNAEKEMFGLERLHAMFTENIDKPPQALIELLNDAIYKWTGKERPDDDVTFMIIKRL
ncbi:MAG: SpoIIE family protein phosphatase [Ignavibacteriales bacterium]|nr:SpoIIE family protein phosphatase [Ignavibacteriales bacterium]